MSRILDAIARWLNRIDPPAGYHHDILSVEVEPSRRGADDAPAQVVSWDGQVFRRYTDIRWLAAGRGRTAARHMAAAAEARASAWHSPAYRARFA